MLLETVAYHRSSSALGSWPTSLRPKGSYLVMFNTAGLKKTCPDLAVERRAVVGFDSVRICIILDITRYLSMLFTFFCRIQFLKPIGY